MYCSSNITKELNHIPIDVAYQSHLQKIKEELRSDSERIEAQLDTFVHRFSNLVSYIRTKGAAYNLVDF